VPIRAKYNQCLESLYERAKKEEVDQMLQTRAKTTEPRTIMGKALARRLNLPQTQQKAT